MTPTLTQPPSLQARLEQMERVAPGFLAGVRRVLEGGCADAIRGLNAFEIGAVRELALVGLEEVTKSKSETANAR